MGFWMGSFRICCHQPREDETQVELPAWTMMQNILQSQLSAGSTQVYTRVKPKSTFEKETEDSQAGT